MPIIQRIEVRCDLMGFWLFYFMENEVEIWVLVADTKEKYSVSSFGNILNNFNNTLIKKHIDKHGYEAVGLLIDGRFKTVKVHSIVAKNFIDASYREKGLVVNHIDFNRKNNKLNNIEVVSIRDNSNKKHLKSTSEYVGVHWDNGTKKWKSTITIGRVKKHLGYYDNEKSAFIAYQDALIYINSDSFNAEWLIPREKVSKHKGVSFSKIHKKWVSYLNINNKRKSLGHFKTEEEAFIALEKAKEILIK